MALSAIPIFTDWGSLCEFTDFSQNTSSIQHYQNLAFGFRNTSCIQKFLFNFSNWSFWKQRLGPVFQFDKNIQEGLLPAPFDNNLSPVVWIEYNCNNSVVPILPVFDEICFDSHGKQEPAKNKNQKLTKKLCDSEKPIFKEYGLSYNPLSFIGSEADIAVVPIEDWVLGVR